MSNSENNAFALPEGRLINGHLFVRSVYKDPKGREGSAKYSAELVYPRPAEGKESVLKDFEDYLYNVLVNQFGAEKVDSYDEKGFIRWPIKDGDKKAVRREADGKPGDAYKNMDIISASSLFNKDGDPAEGGIDVYDENVEDIAPVNKSQVYNGCMGVVAVKAKAYEGTTDNDDPFISCVLYLEAFQMTGEGERLAAAPNRSGLFQKRSKSGGDAAASGSGRRTRN